MQSARDLAKVQAFYYNKIVEGMSVADANRLIQYRCDNFSDNFRDIKILTTIEWDDECSYRIKPEKVIHKDGKIPKPYDEGDDFDVCYVPVFFPRSACVGSKEVLRLNFRETKQSFKLAFKTEADAIAAGKVIFMQGDE